MEDKGLTILAIDTSFTAVSVAVLSEKKIVSEIFFQGNRPFSEILMPLIDRAIVDAGISISQIDGFGVGCGPGSFTGLRIGMATIKGVAFACGKPVVGISSLDALSMNVPCTERLICSMIDARRGEVYSALFRFEGEGKTTRVTEIMILDPGKVLELIEEDTIFLGNGADMYRSLIEENLGSRAQFVPDELSFPRAPTIARLTQEEIASSGGVNPGKLLPLYMRPSQAEMKWGDGWFFRRDSL
jgi:tRNA threonylcarbamoyladenosine biosynthesis protein TsaB